MNSNVLYCCGNESTGAYTCSKCNKIVHVTCGISYEDNEGFGSQVTCNYCVNEENIRINRKKSYEGQFKGAEEMTRRNEAIFDEIETGKYVTVVILKFDRKPLNKKNLEGIIVEKKNNMYKIGTKSGILKN